MYNYVQFKKLVELSREYDIAKEMIKEDIFKSSLIQIGMYSNSLNHINPNFVKENFDSFAQRSLKQVNIRGLVMVEWERLSGRKFKEKTKNQYL